jgi:hypothetical protein
MGGGEETARTYCTMSLTQSGKKPEDRLGLVDRKGGNHTQFYAATAFLMFGYGVVEAFLHRCSVHCIRRAGECVFCRYQKLGIILCAVYYPFPVPGVVSTPLWIGSLCLVRCVRMPSGPCLFFRTDNTGGTWSVVVRPPDSMQVIGLGRPRCAISGLMAI